MSVPAPNFSLSKAEENWPRKAHIFAAWKTRDLPNCRKRSQNNFHSLAFPSIPRICLYPPWLRTRKRVCAVKHTWSWNDDIGIRWRTITAVISRRERRHWSISLFRPTCCSRVIVVCTLMLPCSQGSGIPADPGKKNPAARSCSTRLRNQMCTRQHKNVKPTDHLKVDKLFHYPSFTALLHLPEGNVDR